MEFQKAYKPRKRVGLDFTGQESMTEQHHKDACDIGQIIRKYDKTGILEHVNAGRAEYGDFTEVNEYQESLNLVIRAQDRFAEMPSQIRKKFNNDPGEFMEFVTNPANMDEMVSLGLAERLSEPTPTKVEVVNKEPAEGDTGASAT